MCGICGIVGFKGIVNPGAIRDMTRVIAHRGPDDEGYWWNHEAILGHRRLAIVDRANGRQPMVVQTPRGDVAISYNGEVYNYLELRSQLAADFQFTTRSDTEVILAGYLKWGEQVAERLRGMFAFAIWDGREQKLVLGRDHLGVKTVFYYPIADGVLFGSEPKSIFAHPAANPRIARQGWQEMFAHTSTPGHVIWDGMHEVKPGTTVTITADAIREWRYWRLSSWDHPHDADGTLRYTRDLMERITGEQLVGEVPIGLLSSGGLDSSVLVALASLNWFGPPLKTYCLDFSGGDLNDPDNLLQQDRDAPFADMVGAHCGTDHQTILLASGALADPSLRARTLHARDLTHGIADLDICHLLMFERIRREVTVAWSGQMADELFGGYPIFHRQLPLTRPGWPWKILNHRERAAIERYLHGDFAAALDLDQYLADTFATVAAEVEHLPHESRRDRRLREINYIEITRHAALLLNYTDRLSMASGLEIRLPYCDHRLVEYVFNVPWWIKSPGGEVKGLLKRVARGLLPDEVVDRPKSAFPMPPHLDYVEETQLQLHDLSQILDHPVWRLMGHGAVSRLAQWPAEHVTRAERVVINHTLELAGWLDLHEPAFA